MLQQCMGGVQNEVNRQVDRPGRSSWILALWYMMEGSNVLSQDTKYWTDCRSADLDV